MKRLTSAFLVLILVVALAAGCFYEAPQPSGASRAIGDTNFTNLVASGDITAGDDVTVGGDLAVTGTGTFGSLQCTTSNLGDDLVITGTLGFEGTTADDYETTVSVTDPTADRSIVLPNAPGTVMLSSLATNGVDTANAVTGASDALVFEGATANNFETSLTVVDPTADNTITLPNMTGTALLASSALRGNINKTAFITGTTTIASGLTSITAVQVSLCQAPTASVNAVAASISSTNVVIRAMAVPTNTFAVVGAYVCYSIWGTP